MTIEMIRKVGSSCTHRFNATYQQIVGSIGEPNVTDLDDPYKVKASWGFRDDAGREGFIWCYKQANPEACTSWSYDGDKGLLDDILNGNHLYADHDDFHQPLTESRWR